MRRLVGPPEGSSRERGGWVRLGLTLFSVPTPWAQAGRSQARLLREAWRQEGEGPAGTY